MVLGMGVTGTMDGVGTFDPNAFVMAAGALLAVAPPNASCPHAALPGRPDSRVAPNLGLTAVPTGSSRWRREPIGPPTPRGANRGR
jgi:hypothetical protein